MKTPKLTGAEKVASKSENMADSIYTILQELKLAREELIIRQNAPQQRLDGYIPLRQQLEAHVRWLEKALDEVLLAKYGPEKPIVNVALLTKK